MAEVRYPIETVSGVPVVAAPAEIDASNADWLRAVLLEAAARGHATFVVDMTRTRFCDSARLGALVRAHKRAEAEGGELRLVIPASAAVLRVFALTGIDRVIPNFTSLDEALEPAPAAAPRPPRRRRRPKPGCALPRTGCLPIPALEPARPDGHPRSGARLVPRPVPHRPAARRRVAEHQLDSAAAGGTALAKGQPERGPVREVLSGPVWSTSCSGGCVAADV